ncbi:hypothetical protein ACFX2A_000163 [Malus domestica]
MQESGCQLDAVVYSCLITGFGNQNKMETVYGLLKDMKENDDVVRIYKKMIQNGIKPSIHIYNMIMKSYFQTRNYHIGRAVWDEMIQKGFCLDDNSYTELVQKMKFAGKFEVSNVFARWAEMMRKRVKRRDPIENG